MNFLGIRRAGVAQLAEHKLPKLGVAGSNPVARSMAKSTRLGRLIPLIPAGSATGCTGFVKVGSARFFYCLFPEIVPPFADGRVIPAEKPGTERTALEETTDRLLTTIQGFADPLVQEMGMELVEVQFRREGHGWVLRFFIDKEGGVTIDDCADVSREVSAYLEVEDLISHAYHLEVSSPGLERPLKKKTDFVRFAERLVRIKLREPLDNGERVLIGTLRGLDGEAILLELETETVRIDLENISKARLTL